MKRAKSIKDVAMQYGRILDRYEPNNPWKEVACKTMLNLTKRIAEKIGVPKVYDYSPNYEGGVIWWFDHKIFYANYETKVVL